MSIVKEYSKLELTELVAMNVLNSHGSIML